ncbi:ATP-binding protein [Streptomyces sp. NPDC093109]|uniref:ATP-binding protein n=1 Tax=Streptomyces sp. NPDC093109 TaxID=3154977 RepID=UPI00344E0554
MNAPAPQRPTAIRDCGLVEVRFRIAERQPGEPPAPVDESHVGAMRRVTRERLASYGLDCVADDATLVVSELITNAILHSGGWEIRLTVDLLDGGILRIRVDDGVPGSSRLAVRSPGDDDEHGRGLALVQAIADSRDGSWGTSADGATTWCTLAIGSC